MKIRTTQPVCHVPREVHRQVRFQFNPVYDQPGVFEAEVPDKVGHFLIDFNAEHMPNERMFWEPGEEEQDPEDLDGENAGGGGDNEDDNDTSRVALAHGEHEHETDPFEKEGEGGEAESSSEAVQGRRGSKRSRVVS